MAEHLTWQILVVDDDIDALNHAKEYLEGEEVDSGTLSVQCVQRFDDALAALAARRVDILILDVRMGSLNGGVVGEEAGIHTLRQVRESRFVPVVFHTGLPQLVRGLESPVIRIVEKTSGMAFVLKAIRELLQTNIPTVNRALIKHIDVVQRDYMWKFVAENWSELSETGSPADLAYLLARRLARSLDGPQIASLIDAIGPNQSPPVSSERMHPAQFYVLPVLPGSTVTAGDILKGSVASDEAHWIVLTPSCDLAHCKAEYCILAKCLSLETTKEYEDWNTSLEQSDREPKQADKATTKALDGLLRNNRTPGQPDRYHFLPGALSVPGLVIDFQQLVSVEVGELDRFVRVASLDSPFAEAVLNRFGRYFGRLGTPDLDAEFVLNSLRPRVE